MSERRTKVYIGDSVYAELNPHELILTTENGVSISNRIVIEWRYYHDLQMVVAAFRREANERTDD